MSFRTVGSASSSSQAERIRPSEINGCVVQQVSYLEEIDDEYVLEALERLRGRSLAVPVGAFMTTSQQGRPPLVPKQPLPKKEMQKARVANQRSGDNSTNSSTISPLTVTTSNKVGSGSVSSGIIKGSHRSFDSKTKQKEVPEASPVTPDSSVASSVSGGHQNTKCKPSSKKLTWSWLGKSLSDIHCGSLPLPSDQGIGIVLNEDIAERPKRLISLGVLNRHLVKRCGGGDVANSNDDDDDDDDETETYQSDTVITDGEDDDDDEDSTINDGEDDFKYVRSRKMDFKSKLNRILDATAKLLVEGGFGDNDSVTLYAYNESDYIYGEDNRSLDETFLTLESATYDDETASLAEAPHDEIHQILEVGRVFL